MNYDEYINYINYVPKIGHKDGLKNIKVLLERLSNPQEKLNIIHVAGTNGKGSVCCILNSILRQQGYSVGVFTSPHLEKYNERIKYNDRFISDNEFASIGSKIKSVIEDMLEEGYNHPTFFEIITAMAYLYFSKVNPDFCIIEVGIGGRLDSTNIINNPLVSVITSIGIDHKNILGSTIEEIASEKAGIIKKNRPIVLYYADSKVYNIIEKYAKINNSKLYNINKLEFSDRKIVNNNQVFSIETNHYSYKNLSTSLLGKYQLMNCATALLVISVLKRLEYEIKLDNIHKGLENLIWPGRMELITEDVPILLDGAHNIDGVTSFVNTLEQDYADKNIYLIVGFMNDKVNNDILEKLSTVKNIKKIIITKIDSERALDIVQLECMIKEYTGNYYKSDSILEALSIARDISKNDKKGMICCTGSLYLIGEARKLIT